MFSSVASSLISTPVTLPTFFTNSRSTSEKSFSFSLTTLSFTNECYALLALVSPTLINSFTDALSLTSFFRHLFTKSTSSTDHLEEERAGLLSFCTFLFTVSAQHPAYGFFPSTNSISVMPSDHTSLFGSSFPSNASGAMKAGVPQILC